MRSKLTFISVTTDSQTAIPQVGRREEEVYREGKQNREALGKESR